MDVGRVARTASPHRPGNLPYELSLAPALALAHERMHTAAATCIDELLADGSVDERVAEAPRRMHMRQAEHARRLRDTTQAGDAAEIHAKNVQLKRETIQAERDAVGSLSRDGDISYDTYQLLIHELDLRGPPPHSPK